MNHDYNTVCLLIILLGIIAFPVMGTTLTIDNATLDNVGDTTQVGLHLDLVPQGLTGYALSMSLENPGPAEIISVSFPSWATLSDNSTLPSDTLIILAADLGSQIGNDTPNVPVANMTIRADAPGTTRIIFDSYEINDEDGNPVIPVIEGGYITVTGPDMTPPAGVTGLHNTTYQQDLITWVWSDPPDSDFSKVMVFLDGVFQTNVTKGAESYTAGSLLAGTQHTIGTRTVDSADNSNATWVNQTAMTAPAQPVAPDSITSLANTTYQQNLITWNWTDPTSAEFDHVMVFLDGVFQTNVTGGSQTFTASGLRPSTAYTISTHTVGATGLINGTWVNNSAWTAPVASGQKGVLYVHSIPRNAIISIDGTERGRTNQLVTDVPAGTRTLTLTKPGYQTETIVIDVPPGTVKALRRITLQPLSSPSVNTGTLWVYSVPRNAIISIDGTERGHTTKVVTDVPAGTRTLTLTKPGYDQYTLTVSVPAGGIKVLTPITLTKSGDRGYVQGDHIDTEIYCRLYPDSPQCAG